MITSTRCANCGSELVGDYCHVCGQQRIDNPEVSLRPFVRQFRDELVHLDFKTLRSLAALFRPGLLTESFLAGHRREYLSPPKVYLLAAAVFFFIAPLVGFNLFDILAGDEGGVFRDMVETRRQQRGISQELFEERFDIRFQSVYTAALAISVVVAALTLRILFRPHTLGAHLVFALHYVAFLYLAALGLAAIQKLVPMSSTGASLVITYAVLVPYLFVAFRRVYRGTAASTILKVLALCAVSFVVDSLVNFGAFLLTMWLI
jgi:hypothetical protein